MKYANVYLPFIFICMLACNIFGEKSYNGSQISTEFYGNIRFYDREGDYPTTDKKFTADNVGYILHFNEISSYGVAFCPGFKLEYSYGFQNPFYLETFLSGAYRSKSYLGTIQVPSNYEYDRPITLSSRDISFGLGIGTTAWSINWVDAITGAYAGSSTMTGATKIGVFGGIGLNNCYNMNIGSEYYTIPYTIVLPADIASLYNNKTYLFFFSGFKFNFCLGPIGIDFNVTESDNFKKFSLNFGLSYLWLNSGDVTDTDIR